MSAKDLSALRAHLAVVSGADFAGQTQNLNSLVNLLEATAHDPNQWGTGSGYSSEDGEDYDSSNLDDEEEDSPPPSTPNDSRSDLASPAIATPSSREDGISSPVIGARADHGASGKALTESPKFYSLQTTDDELVAELTLDGIDSVDDAMERAKSGKKGDEEEVVRDPLDQEGDEEGEKEKKAKLKVLTDEFGEWSDEGEEWIMQIPGALYRGVLVKGLLALTNKRLFIYAYIPLPEKNRVVRSGPITIHIPNLVSKKRRCWFELKSDSVTWYPSSDKLYRPIGSCRLSQTKGIMPYDPAEPKIVRVELIDGRMRYFELDTEESAIAWRADMEATIFTFRATADRLRLALPLQHISTVDIEPYMQLATRVSLRFSVLCDKDRQTISRTSSVSSNESFPTDTSEMEQTVEFGYLKSHTLFGERLRTQVEAAQTTPRCSGAKAILEIDSESKEEELEDMRDMKEDKTLPGRFAKLFALEDDPSELFVAPNCQLVRSLPNWGSLCISQFYLCFYRKVRLGTDVKMRIPLSDIDDAGQCKSFGFRIFGMAVQVRGAPDVRLDFHSRKLRDQVIAKIKDAVLVLKAANLTTSVAGNTSVIGGSLSDSSSVVTAGATSTISESSSSPYTMTPLRGVFEARADRTFVLGQNMEESVSVPAGLPISPMPKVLGAIGKRKISGLHFVCLTIGSRGDVQPYIALGLELMKDGNTVTIASHPEYRAWVESFGMGYRDVGGDPAALMKLSVEHKMFSPGFFKESLGHFRQWLDDLFKESWEACQEADILIESPSTMAGIHVAEGLHIPYFRAFTMPWSSTATYPHAFAASVDLGPTYNVLSYSLFDTVIWKAISGQVNRWRKNTMNLERTNLHKMSQTKTPFIYNFSSSVVPKPNDWKDYITISGYWFLDSNETWTPPAGLAAFIQKARDDEKPVIYIGFGSIVVPDAVAMTKAVVAAVLNSGVRAILSRGWSDRGATPHEEVVLPEEIFAVASIPHDRLFPHIDAACHHGGAGTTGASLRAGLPTLIHPFFGDQFFWSSRVEKLGAGVKISSLSEKDLTAAFIKGTTDRVMREKAAAVGDKIRSENGPRMALDFIYEHIHLAEERGALRAARARNEKPEKPEKPERQKSDRSEKRAHPMSCPTAAFRKQSPNRSRSSTPLGFGRIKTQPLRAATLPTPHMDDHTAKAPERTQTSVSNSSLQTV